MKRYTNHVSVLENGLLRVHGPETFMTKTGLAVLFDIPCYISNDGKFRRYMTQEETEYIKKNCQKIHLQGGEITVELPEKWRSLWSWRVSDYTSYKPETCNNGGDYAFHQTHNIFGRMNGDKLELLDVIRHSTSAEFSYDEANGSFQNSGMAHATFVDCEAESFRLFTQTGYYDEDGYPIDREYSLNQFGQEIPIQEAIQAGDTEYNGNEDDPTNLQNASYEEQVRREDLLKEYFGWTPRVHYRR